MTSARKPSLLPIPVRIVLVTFLLTLMSFAVTLLFAILATVIVAYVRGVHPNMTLAYRLIAAPIAGVVAAIVFLTALVFEIRRYYRTKSVPPNR